MGWIIDINISKTKAEKVCTLMVCKEDQKVMMENLEGDRMPKMHFIKKFLNWKLKRIKFQVIWTLK